MKNEKSKNQKIAWVEVFGLGRNNSFKIKPEYILKIPGHIFLNLDEIDNNDKED
jgi:hypothetical protein